MPAKITFTQKEESGLRGLLAQEDYLIQREHDDGVKALKSLLAKMEKAKTTKEDKFSGISVKQFLSLAEEKLPKLKKHPNPTAAWFIKMQQAINAAGISEDIAIKGIEAAKSSFTGDIWVETLIHSLAKLASGAQSSLPFKKTPVGFTPTKKSGWLGRLNE